MVKSESRRDTETFVSNPRPRIDCFLKSEPETLRFQNSSKDAVINSASRKKWVQFFLQRSVALCASSKKYFLINQIGNLRLLCIQITSFTVAIATLGAVYRDYHFYFAFVISFHTSFHHFKEIGQNFQ